MNDNCEAHVRLIRPDSWRGRLSAYKVIIDGKKQGTIKNDETRKFEISPGRHRVQVRINWTGSRPLDISVRPDSTVSLECTPGPLATGGVDAILSFFGRPWVDLHAVDESEESSTS